MIRDTLTKEINIVLRKFEERLDHKLNLLSYIFQIGYTSKLWKDTKDIEFIKQIIGHRSLDITSAYIKELSDQERRDRISQRKTPSYKLF